MGKWENQKFQLSEADNFYAVVVDIFPVESLKKKKKVPKVPEMYQNYPNCLLFKCSLTIEKWYH